MRPIRCHSERSEESPQFAQGKLREESRQLLVELTTAEILRFAQNDRPIEMEMAKTKFRTFAI